MPLRKPEPWVAQNAAHQLVGQQLRPVRPDRQRRLPSRLADDLVRLVRALAMLIVDLRQVGSQRRSGRSVDQS